MLRKSLEQARGGAGEAQVGASQRVEEARVVLETLQADADSTTSTEEGARRTLNEETEALEAAQATVTSEEVLCSEAADAKALVAEERQKHEAAKAEVESVQNGTFLTLLGGGWEEEEVRDMCIEGVCGYLQSEGADVVLLAALPKAFRCRPAECGAFDKIAVDEASRYISAKVAACNAQLAQGAEEFEDITAEHSGAQAILDLAREKVEAASKVRDSAEAALSSATVDKKLALSKVMDQDTALAASLSESVLADAKVQQLDLALRSLAQLEAGEVAETENKENVMEGSKENIMEVDDESKVQAMALDQAMAVDQLQLPIAA